MKDERTLRTAETYNIAELVNSLETALLEVSGVTDVEFDLDGFYDNMNQVIFLTKYEIPPGSIDYYGKRRRLISEVIDIAKEYGLSRTEDHIEDYGEHFYFVFSCDERWLNQPDKEEREV